MSSQSLVALVHLAGFTTGIVLYAMLAVMTLRRRAARTDRGQRGPDGLPLAASALGLIWNSGALVIYGLRDFGLGTLSPVLDALAFAALGFLPAVVVSATVRRLQPSIRRVLAPAGYALSAVAGVLQAIAAAHGEVPSRVGLLTLTLGYGAILVILLLFAARGHEGWRRSLSLVALALFAVSALHLSHHADRSTSWITELIGHHASLPLVLVILYQDYRFAFADLFLRRAISLLTLVVLVVVLYVLVASPMLAPSREAGQGGLATGALIGLWIATALAYPWLRDAVGRFVDRVVLERTDDRALRERITRALDTAHTAEDVLAAACSLLATAFSARFVHWRESEPRPHGPGALVSFDRDGLGGATVLVPTSESPAYAVEVAELAGGRRLLSDDIGLLEWVAVLVARRIDLVRVARERFARDLRESEIMQLATEAELLALRAQLNPHFLFNALTTIGYLVRTAPDRAIGTLYRLTDLLRAVLRRSARGFVALAEELEIVDAYLAIEHERFEERLRVVVDVPPALLDARIPPLLVQPLVENAIKYGITPLRRGGTVTIEASLEEPTGDGPPALRLAVVDTGVGPGDIEETWRARGVGLANIEQRLAHYYGDGAHFRLYRDPQLGTVAEIRIPMAGAEGLETMLRASLVSSKTGAW